ncbi:MAG TPA: transposase, partial [Ktedonobacteraceae bacterium]|nr:transposase [Ktedonobacteraceae bacterium]
GSYFVTIRTKDFEPLFEIPELRIIVNEIWKALPQRFSSVTLDEFIFMPDHVHFIIHIEGNVEKPSSLGDVVGAFKSLASGAWLHHIKTTGMERSGRVWQGNYFERIIRDTRDLECTRQYIRDNPTRRKAKRGSAEHLQDISKTTRAPARGMPLLYTRLFDQRGRV